MASPELEALRTNNPAARVLPLLEALAEVDPDAAPGVDVSAANPSVTTTEPAAAASADGSLAIGSLKGAPRYE